MFEFNIETNEMKEIKVKGKSPCERVEHSSVIDKSNQIYIFGGTSKDLL